jgi:hypothetical protein
MCVMAAMAWGDRWRSDGVNVPVRVAHLGCSDLIHGELRCRACGEVLDACDVRFNRRPEALDLRGDNS